MSRDYPALDLIWRERPSDERLDILLAEVDDERPVAVQEHDDRLRLFFPTTNARDFARDVLAEAASDLVLAAIDVPDEAWAERSQASLGAVQVGRLTIAPPWAVPDAGDVIVIQPSMGFGTAHHASTRLCLRALQARSVTGAQVLDVGTGSGVLAIAAARLGAARAIGVDNDPDALRSARENRALNQLDGRVELDLLDLENPDRPDAARRAWPDTFDVVLANLTGATLIRFAATLAAFVASGGTIITSGYGPDEAAGVIEAFARHTLSVETQLDEGEWTAVVLTRAAGTPG